MKSFKVGDRVRIVCPASPKNGQEAVVWAYVEKPNWSIRALLGGANPNLPAYRVDIAGKRLNENGAFYAYHPHELEPIVNPDEKAWSEFKRFLQPDPIILAKEPA